MPFKLDPDNDPNVAYEVRPADVPPGWFEVTCNGVGVHYFSGGIDAGCNCGAPLMSKAQRAAQTIADDNERGVVRSDRAIAKEVGVDHKTVGAARKSVGEHSPPDDERRIGADGKQYPARRATGDCSPVDEPRIGLDGRTRRLPTPRAAAVRKESLGTSIGPPA